MITADHGTNLDHTLCTVLNDLHAHERQESRVNHKNHQLTGKISYRYFLGVKWSCNRAE
ncbi:MAG: hypothetical protein QOF67_2438 [Mycobacterium sp.]|nr:hypothetical protein [Mycobacterium sp.]